MPAGWMIDERDPARFEIAARAAQLGITGDPDKSAHSLGKITLADGTVVNAFVVHAVDAIITDGTSLVAINRDHDPGKGKPALPGGLIDPTANGPETALVAAAREAHEEASAVLDAATGRRIGTRNMNRPFDVRIAKNDALAKYGIKEGDAFMVSTQAVRFDVKDLKALNLAAGDDAEPGSVRSLKIGSITREMMGVPDHFDLIVGAFPEQFRHDKKNSPPRP
jgi:8-oxo-dGTP pyrophosphatase MutT (NUDIX family)